MEFTPKECTQYPGFYHPIGTDLVVVSRDGRVINLKTGNEIQTKPNENGYTTLGVWIKVDGKDVYKNFNLHRLLALAFIPIPDNLKHLRGRQLTVNHEDTNKRNNSIGNLEWMSTQHNTIHAQKHGLNVAAKAVLAKHYSTGEIKRFISINECAKAFDIDDQKLRTHLNTEEAGTYFFNDYTFKFDDDSLWPEFDDVVKPFLHHRAVVAYNVKTNQKVLDVSTKSLFQNLQISFTGYGNHVRAKGANVPYHNWLVRDIDLSNLEDMIAFKEWDYSKEKELHHTVVSYKVTHRNTGHEVVLNGLKEVCKHVNYSVGRVTESLKLHSGQLGDYVIQKLDRFKLLKDAT